MPSEARVARARRQRSRGPAVLAVVALGAAVVAACSVLWQAWHAAPIDLNHHCGFDGWSWCRMATGGTGDRPYERRFLVALLVSLTRPTLGDAWVRFFVVDAVSVAGLLVGVAALTRRVALHLGAPRSRGRDAAIIAASALALGFYSWHFSLQIPVNTDVPSAALGLCWLLVVTSGDDRRAWWSVPLACATQASRDTWAAPLLLACGVLLLLVPSRRRLAVANAFAVGVAIGISLLVHATPGSYTPALPAVFSAQLRSNFGSIHGLVIYLWLVAFGLGALSLFALPTLHRARRDPVLAVPWALAIGSVAVATVAGGTTDRYLLPTLVVLLGLGLGWVASRRSLALDVALIPALAVTVGIFRPWETMSGSVPVILKVYDPFIQPWSINKPLLLQHLAGIAVAAAVGALVAGIVVAVQRRTWLSATSAA